MDSQPSAKRERKANFSDVEVRVLLDVYRQHQVRLNAKFSNVITHRLKTALWLEVATALSACGHSTRLVSDVRKKWTDLNSAALKAWDEANRPKTGGGPKVEPPWFTEMVLDVLGDDTTLVNGFTS